VGGSNEGRGRVVRDGDARFGRGGHARLRGHRNAWLDSDRNRSRLRGERAILEAAERVLACDGRRALLANRRRRRAIVASTGDVRAIEAEDGMLRAALDLDTRAHGAAPIQREIPLGEAGAERAARGRRDHGADELVDALRGPRVAAHLAVALREAHHGAATGREAHLAGADLKGAFEQIRELSRRHFLPEEPLSPPIARPVRVLCKRRCRGPC
jgi:hypothetical protein